MNVVILSPIWPEAVARLRSRHRCTVTAHPRPEELRRLLVEAEAVVIRSGVRLDRPALEAAPLLRLIVRAGVGVDGIDVPCAEERGQEITEKYLRRLKELAQEHGIAWQYAPLHHFLNHPEEAA